MSTEQGAPEERKRGPGASRGSDLVGGQRWTAALYGRPRVPSDADSADAIL